VINSADVGSSSANILNVNVKRNIRREISEEEEKRLKALKKES